MQVSSWKNKDLIKFIICDEQNVKKDALLANISLAENAEKTLREYSELHNKNKNVKYTAEANRTLLVLNTKSLLVADVAYHSSCYEAFRCTGWKKQLHKKLM